MSAKEKAANVIDHFHVIKLFNEKLTKLRCDLQRDAEKAEDKKVFKGIRWLLMLNPDNLAQKKESARERLKKALELNEPLSIAYYLKEELRVIWLQDSKEKAANLFTDWVTKADASGIRMLKSFARTLTRLRHSILAYYDFNGLSSAKIEGFVNARKSRGRIFLMNPKP